MTYAASLTTSTRSMRTTTRVWGIWFAKRVSLSNYFHRRRCWTACAWFATVWYFFRTTDIKITLLLNKVLWGGLKTRKPISPHIKYLMLSCQNKCYLTQDYSTIFLSRRAHISHPKCCNNWPAKTLIPIFHLNPIYFRLQWSSLRCVA